MLELTILKIVSDQIVDTNEIPWGPIRLEVDINPCMKHSHKTLPFFTPRSGTVSCICLYKTQLLYHCPNHTKIILSALACPVVRVTLYEGIKMIKCIEGARAITMTSVY